MTLFQTLIIAIIQGITEFIPVSSSGHLTFIPILLGWKHHELIIDIAVHLGTLCSVIIYFWKDNLLMFKGSINMLKGKIDKGGNLLLKLTIATIPAIIIGLIITELGINSRNLKLLSFNIIIFGILLYYADHLNVKKVKLHTISYKSSFIIGCMQALALIPGVSRSGISITGSLFKGLNRKDAVRFSFLMSIPVTIAAAVHTVYKAIINDVNFLLQEIILGIFVSFITGIIVITFMMYWIKNSSFTIFVVYRIIIGIILLYFAFTF